MATCDGDITGKTVISNDNSGTSINSSGAGGDATSPAVLSFAEYQKMPDWKKELIQKRKNVAKVITGSSSSNSLIEDVTTATNPELDTVTTTSYSALATTTAASAVITSNDIMINTPAVPPVPPTKNNKLGNSATAAVSAVSSPSSPSPQSPTMMVVGSIQPTTSTGHSQQQQQMNYSLQQKQQQHATVTTATTITGTSNNKIAIKPPEHNTTVLNRADAVAAQSTNTSTLYNREKATATTTTLNADTHQSSCGIVAEQETPFLLQSQSHSRHGNERVDCFAAFVDSSCVAPVSTSTTVVDTNNKTTNVVTNTTTSATGTQKCTFNKNTGLSVNIPNKPFKQSTLAVSAATNKYLKLSERNNQRKELQQQQQQHNSGSGTKMVAMQEVISENFSFDDTSEELQYGPGIVSKLRCRYLSLALRQSASKQRPSLDNLRRATSLNNLLDDEPDDSDANNRKGWTNGQNHRNADEKARTPDEYISSFQRKQFEQNENRVCRPVQRGNESLKRARSVEALMRYDQNAWQRDMITDAAVVQSPTIENGVSNPAVLEEITNETTNHQNKMLAVDVVTIEDKIVNARAHGEHKPKRLTSFMDETERPPPDLVKHTLRIFEASANRRPKAAARLGNGDVASKVANYKTIISQEKPAIVFPKPPLSPKKPMVAPRSSTTSPKHSVLNGIRVVAATTNGHNGTGAKPPKIGAPTITNGGSVPIKKVTIDAQCRSPSPLTVRIDTAYRTNKLDSPLSPLQQQISRNNSHRPMIDSPFLSSPLSPISASQHNRSPLYRPENSPSPDLLQLLNNQQKSNDSPMVQLAKKIESLTLDSSQNSTPQSSLYKANHFSTDLTASSVDDDDQNDYGTESDVDNSSSTIETPSKRISKSALANISKAGMTTEFKFGGKSGKSYLPGGSFNGTTSTPKKVTDDVPSTNVRQIGIIRPQVKNPPPMANNQQVSNSIVLPKLNSVKDNVDAPASVVVVAAVPSASSKDDKPKRDNLLITNLMSANTIMLTSREIEKNLINKEKSEEVSKWTNVSPKTATTTGSTTTYQKPWQQPDIQNNTMVFNFSNRKDVPDYIENDGLVVRRKRELPKPGESGFVLLGDLTVETSTDPDDSWTLGPPSPCDVEFENDNVIIDGKSSIRNKSKEQKLKIHFSDTLTSTFEYPSENSLLLDDGQSSDVMMMVMGEHNGIALNNGGSSGGGLLGSMPIGSAPLGSYTPIKASLNTNFELGVTRSQTSAPYDDPMGTSATTNGTTSMAQHQGNGGGSVIPANNGDVSDSLQYLKPATDEQTVAWSEGTRVTDLLF